MMLLFQVFLSVIIIKFRMMIWSINSNPKIHSHSKSRWRWEIFTKFFHIQNKILKIEKSTYFLERENFQNLKVIESKKISTTYVFKKVSENKNKTNNLINLEWCGCVIISISSFSLSCYYCYYYYYYYCHCSNFLERENFQNLNLKVRSRA